MWPIRLKKMPIDSTMAEFMNVAAMPPPAPRWLAGRLFMMLARLGEKKMPMPRPLRMMTSANTG